MTEQTRPGRPLDGIRVVDASRVIAGPFCGSILADLGADVVRVEHPTPKDEVRSWKPVKNGYAAAFFAVNHSKRSLAVDLTKPQGAAILHKLLKTADVFLENFRPGTLERYGVDVTAVRVANPGLIHCAVRAFPAGCAAERLPGYEASIQAYSGIMSITGEHDGDPCRCGASVVDLGTGLVSVIAILSALRDRDSTGHGQYVEPALLRTATNLLTYQIAGYFMDGSLQQRRGSGHEALTPYRAYPCSDGMLFIGAGNDRLWSILCKVLVLSPEGEVPFAKLADRIAHREKIDAMIVATASTWKRAALLEALTDAGIPSSPVNTIADYVNEPTLHAAGVLDKIDVDGLGEVVLPGAIFGSEGAPPQRRPAPRIGEHSAEILAALGVKDAELADLKAQGIVQ